LLIYEHCRKPDERRKGKDEEINKNGKRFLHGNDAFESLNFFFLV